MEMVCRAFDDPSRRPTSADHGSQARPSPIAPSTADELSQSSRTAGAGPSPTSTTCASATPKIWTVNAQRRERRSRRRGCRCWTTWSWRSHTQAAIRRPSSRVCRRSATRRSGARTARLPAPRRGRRAVRPGPHEVVTVVTRPDLPPGPWSRSCARATERTGGSCGRPRWSSAAQRGEHRWPRDFYDALGVRRTPAPTRSSRRTGSWPASTTRTSTRTRRRGEVQGGQRGLPGAVRPGHPQRYDRFGEDFRQVPEDYDERVRASAARVAAGGGAGGCTPVQRRRRSRAPSSTSRTCSGRCSAAAAGRTDSRAPTRRPSWS